MFCNALQHTILYRRMRQTTVTHQCEFSMLHIGALQVCLQALEMCIMCFTIITLFDTSLNYLNIMLPSCAGLSKGEVLSSSLRSVVHPDTALHPQAHTVTFIPICDSSCREADQLPPLSW